MPASAWIRCLQLLPYLEEAGIGGEVNEPDTDAAVCCFVRHQDAAALDLARNLKRRGCRIVVDFCVNYFAETGLICGVYGATKERVDEALRMVEVADAVTCASAFIADRARRHHANVHYLPDSVDERHFAVVKSAAEFGRSPPRAIWSGVGSKLKAVEQIAHMLHRHGIPLTVVSEQAPVLQRSGLLGIRRNMAYTFEKWRYETFPLAILGGEVCISPREVDNPYDQGHSFFKIAVFMAEGVPALAGPVPSYSELLGSGRGGRICRTLQEWDETLAAVARDPGILARWSVEAREAVKPFTTARVAAQYAALFRDLCRAAG